MTITVRTLRNAVDAGFRKLSGAPLKLRRAKLLFSSPLCPCAAGLARPPPCAG
jgi:hypothetical protein